MIITASALPLQHFVHLCVTVTSRGRTGVHSVDGGVGSLESVAGGVVL
jgi:hypothetical protein